jgi:hypothetical protein
MTTKTQLRRLERLAPRVVWTPSAALLASVMAKAERALDGRAAEPADWTNARPDVVAHRERLLEWVRTKPEPNHDDEDAP